MARPPQFTGSVPPADLAAMRELAAENDRSIAAEFRRAVRAHLAAHNNDREPAGNGLAGKVRDDGSQRSG
jgi:hypothetical protein